jgi:hypothetical protein
MKWKWVWIITWNNDRSICKSVSTGIVFCHNASYVRVAVLQFINSLKSLAYFYRRVTQFYANKPVEFIASLLHAAKLMISRELQVKLVLMVP